LAGLKSVLGDTASAEKIYSKVIKDHPKQSGGYLMLARLFQSEDRLKESKEVLDSGLANSEDTSRLQFMRATELEVEGDFEGAIDIYANLYEQTPGSDLLANNLASLLSEHRSDEVSLDRAFTVSRRLRDSDFPPYQDTYGWVLYLRGDYEKALAVLTKAQAGLAENPVFQYHLGMTYLQLKQTEAAVPLLEAAIKTANENHLILPQIDSAKAELAKLQSGSAN
jgi:tetratricopeptide (TPR) repeat protein